MNDRAAERFRELRLRHLRIGWFALFCFASIGLILEALHGFKVGAYLDVGNDTRRLLWRLGHAHGALLGLIHVAFAASVPHVARAPRLWVSRCLTAATFLLPGGFLLGGINPRGGDPGLGILLVPPGGLLLIVALGLAAKASFDASVRSGPLEPRAATEKPGEGAEARQAEARPDAP